MSIAENFKKRKKKKGQKERKKKGKKGKKEEKREKNRTKIRILKKKLEKKYRMTTENRG